MDGRKKTRERRKKRSKMRRKHKKTRFTDCKPLPKTFYFKDCHEIQYHSIGPSLVSAPAELVIVVVHRYTLYVNRKL